MNCPKCSSSSQVKVEQTGNDGYLYVAEEFDGSEECYDSDIFMYKCYICNCIFYVSEE